MSAGRWLFAAALALASASGAARAEEGIGCDSFRWPLDRERAALVDPAKPSLPNGGALAYDAATTLELQPMESAQLPKPPERASKYPDTFAGHFVLPAPAKPGIYKVTISAEGWVDVLDGPDFLHPKAFTAAKSCEGARKSMKFALPGRPLAIQFTGVRDKQISVIISPEL